MTTGAVKEPPFQFHIQLKTVDDEERLIEGYASTSDVDRVDEVIEPGAFRRSLKSFVKNGVILAYHRFDMPIGKPVEAEIDDKGLKITARIAKGISPDDHVEQVWNLIKQGVLSAFSVGFRPLKVENVESDGEKRGVARRRITDLDLYETSVVPIPANPHARFALAKAFEDAADHFEDKIFSEEELDELAVRLAVARVRVRLLLVAGRR